MNAEHILIVEDDIIAQMTLSQMLEDMGYASVSTASNMKETQAILTSEPIDLALLDVFLHGEREGIKVAEFIHRNRTPFIFLTASHDSETYHLMNELNHSGILEKPYDYDDINHAVLNVLSTISKASESDSAVPESLTDLETNLIFDSIAIGVCVINNQGKIIRANDAICEIFDLPTDRVKNSKLEELIPGIKGSARLSKDLIKNRVAHEERIVTKHGKTIDLSITQAGFRSGEGIYQVVTVTDISSQKKSLKQLEEQVVKNNELIAEIHDRVKNSLNTVSGLLYLKEQNQSDKDAKNQFKKVRQRVRLLAKIHTLFFRDDILKTILSKEFVKSLALEISAIFMTGVIIKPKKVSSFQLSNDLAIRIGLIIHELILIIMEASHHEKEVLKIDLSVTEEKNYLLLEIFQDSEITEGELNKENLGYKIIKSICGEDNIAYMGDDFSSFVIRLLK